MPLLITLSIIPPWTLAETERLREEFGATLDTDDVDDLSETISELETILARMPIYDADKAKVLGIQEIT